MDTPHDTLGSWVGRSQTRHDLLAAAPVQGLRATLDLPAQDVADGAPLPPLWHWLYFLPRTPASEIGPDGHARLGDFLPPVPLPRRMWAGSRFEFLAPLCVGQRAWRRSTIENVVPKQGRSGALVFVTVRHELGLDGRDEVALREWHDIVYRAAPASDEPEPAAQAAPATPAWQRRWLPDEVMLFRYSALTFNGHRIHYDRRYVTEVEGYPGLVVHGPLIATLLLDLLGRQLPGHPVAQFQFKALRPSFDGQPITVCGQPGASGREVQLWAQDAQGRLLMQAQAVLR
jgi:3-methylfumaryl-CoA hydratase